MKSLICVVNFIIIIIIIIITSYLFSVPSLGLLRVHLNDIENIAIRLNVPENYGFHIKIGHFRLFLHVTPKDASYALMVSDEQRFGSS